MKIPVIKVDSSEFALTKKQFTLLGGLFALMGVVEFVLRLFHRKLDHDPSSRGCHAGCGAGTRM